GGGGVGGAGAGSGNTINDLVSAFVQNGSTVTAGGGNASVLASDVSAITADAGGVSLAVGGGGDGAGVGLSLGVGCAGNAGANWVTPFVDASPVTATGGVAVTAAESATIKALSIGGAGATGVSSEGGVAVAGAGAGSNNTILDVVQAVVSGGT